MKSSTTAPFWKCYADLPGSVKKQAKKALQLFLEDAYHPSLHFKKVHSTQPILQFGLRKIIGRWGRCERRKSSGSGLARMRNTARF